MAYTKVPKTPSFEIIELIVYTLYVASAKVARTWTKVART